METEEGKGGYQTTPIVRNKLVGRKKTHIRTKSTGEDRHFFLLLGTERETEVVTLSPRY